MGALEDFYNNPDVLNAIVGNQQYATGQKPPVVPPYMGSQIPTPPEDNHVLEVLKGLGGLGGTVGHTGQDIFSTMQRAVTEGPYSSTTGEYDPKIGMLAPQLMLPGMGRALGGVGAELGAFGAIPRRLLGKKEISEMNSLIKAHPEREDLIRESYGLPSSISDLPTISPTMNKGSTPQRLPPSSLPREVPTSSKPHNPGERSSRAIDDEMLADARDLIKNGASIRSVAEDLGVHHETLRYRLDNPYSIKTADESFRNSPRASILNSDSVRELILTMKRSGETDLAIAQELQKRMPGQKITEKMVGSQITGLRNKNRLNTTNSSGIPLHPFFGQEADTQKEPYVDLARERIDNQDFNRSIEHYERYRKGKPPVPEVQPPQRGNMISTMDILNILRQQSGQAR